MLACQESQASQLTLPDLFKRRHPEKDQSIKNEDNHSFRYRTTLYEVRLTYGRQS